MSSFLLYPAIDVREGRVVRLRQGDFSRETRYTDEPIDVARRYSAAGAEWLHLVDLDAARGGGYQLAPLLSRIKAQTRLKVQTGGGVRSEADLRLLFDAGADRVVVGSMAVRESATVAGWIGQYGPERITLALDTRRSDDGRWLLPVHGWTRDGGKELDSLAAAYADLGLRHLLVTDIRRDGMMAGPNVELYDYLVQRFPDLQVQASGGVRDLDDVRAARATGCAGVVLGKALLDGSLDLVDCLLEAEAC